MARAYMKREQPHWVEGHYQRFENRIVRDVHPVIGPMHPNAVNPIDVTRAFAGIESRGAQAQPSARQA